MNQCTDYQSYLQRALGSCVTLDFENRKFIFPTSGCTPPLGESQAIIYLSANNG